MFELMLMRHAKSDWSTHAPDIDRPLNKRGRQDAGKMGHYLKQHSLVPHRMIISPSQRTRETADILLEHIFVPEEQRIIDRDLYLADVYTLREMAGLYSQDNKRLLMLAHNPGMDEFVSFLASEPLNHTANGKLMTTGALACFQLDSVESLKVQGKGKLKCLVRPKEINDSV